ncbi:oligoribonuclease NrnB/cAMP/cGMP phosphodiesterase (DHH superfamily) [Melaminivora alkalimesophila]|uniref:Oligoribonuclease NrnB/cAMP/cGMP phosphodiesterase (DHH superfamily) n=2 Tax=Melaminivora alkalimesophila TaxID=1165852 RepID=A0A317RB68_9BURK|nr:oligoribonuclease NrnB/cAMP/cGMP phosphodiesterase (DHH superfamily) [Melaminivora alkalimesophila]
MNDDQAMSPQSPAHLLWPQFAPSPDDPSPLVLYHGRCADGFAAALAAWRFHGGQVECVPLNHGQVTSLADLPPLEGRFVYILDFAFGPELTAQIDAAAGRLVLLDHHKSAAERLAGCTSRNGVLHFDMQRSGARLAWEYFFPQGPLPDLVRLVEDRDLWNWRHPETAGFVAALDLEPHDFPRWSEIADFTPAQVQEFVARGRAMDEKFRHLADDIARAARPLRFNGETGWMVNAPGAFHSLVGDIVSRRYGGFALMWTVAEDGQIRVGLRSQRDYDCSPLAVRMGGGGHAQACGFRLPPEMLPALLQGDLQAP